MIRVLGVMVGVFLLMMTLSPSSEPPELHERIFKAATMLVGVLLVFPEKCLMLSSFKSHVHILLAVSTVILIALHAYVLFAQGVITIDSWFVGVNSTIYLVAALNVYHYWRVSKLQPAPAVRPFGP